MAIVIPELTIFKGRLHRIIPYPAKGIKPGDYVIVGSHHYGKFRGMIGQITNDKEVHNFLDERDSFLPKHKTIYLSGFDQIWKIDPIPLSQNGLE